jgi:putative hydrolase
MRIIADCHFHTVASQHAYSTITEYCHFASQIGLDIIGVTDHGPAMADGPHEYYFSNLRILPRKLEGVTLLRGAELNIVDDSGGIDLRSHVIKELDYVIASYHNGIFPYYYTSKQLTEGYLKVMDEPKVRILGHPDNPRVPFDHESVLKKAKEKNVLIEVNNASYGYIRPGSYEVGKQLLTLAKKMGNSIILSSDAHFHEDIGKVPMCIQLVKEVGYPEHLIVNLSKDRMKEFFDHV